MKRFTSLLNIFFSHVRSPAHAESSRQLKTAGIMSIRTLKPPSRTLVGATVWMFIIYLACELIATLIILAMEDYRLSSSQFLDTKAMVSHLAARDRPEMQSLWHALEQSVGETPLDLGMSAAEPVDMDEARFHLRKRLNQLIESERFILGAKKESWAPDILLLADQASADPSVIARVNRKVLEALFPGMIASWNWQHKLDGWHERLIGDIRYGRVAFLDALVLLSYALFPVAVYYYILSTLEVTLRDRQEVERFLANAAAVLGFKESGRSGNERTYRAKWMTILIYFVLGMRARHNENTLVITAPLPFIRKLKKHLPTLQPDVQ